MTMRWAIHFLWLMIYLVCIDLRWEVSSLTKARPQLPLMNAGVMSQAAQCKLQNSK